MEKIKQAISKAKSQRDSNIPNFRENQVFPATANETQEPDLETVSYVQTQTVTLSPKILENHRIVAGDKNNQASWIFDLLRTQVLQKMEENNWRTLAIISPTPEAGKTFVAINLAMSIAHHPQKSVILVDFDLRRPKIASYLGLTVTKSMNDYLAGTAALSETMINPGIPRLVVIPTNKPVAKSAEVLSSKKVENLVKELRERYESRIVILDLPPILNVDDAMVILPNVDCVLMVVGNGLNSEKEIEETKRLLPAVNFLGVVLNRAETPARDYYY